MAIPLRKDEPQEIVDQKLTTADLAKGQRAATEPKGPRPVMGERMPAEQDLEQAAREPKQSASGAQRHCSPTMSWKLCAVAERSSNYIRGRATQGRRRSRWLGGFCDEAVS